VTFYHSPYSCLPAVPIRIKAWGYSAGQGPRNTDVLEPPVLLLALADIHRLRRRPAPLPPRIWRSEFLLQIFIADRTLMPGPRPIGDLLLDSRKPSHHVIGQSNAVLVCQRNACLRAEFLTPVINLWSATQPCSFPRQCRSYSPKGRPMGRRKVTLEMHQEIN